MKKAISLVIALIMAMSMIGCSKSESATNDQAASEALANILSKAAEETGKEAPADQSDTAMTKTPAAATGEFDTSGVIEETVLYDKDGIKITATGLSYTEYDIEVGILIENETDKNYSFLSGSYNISPNAINGYMFDTGYLSEEVAAGKKVNSSIDFSMDEVILTGISCVAELTLGFEMNDDDYNNTPLGIHVIPTQYADSYDYGADTFSAVKADPERLAQVDINFVKDAVSFEFEENGAKLLSATLATNAFTDNELLIMEWQNTSSEFINVNLSDVYINGVQLSLGTELSFPLLPGKYSVQTIDLSYILYDNYKAVLGFEEITNISLYVYTVDENRDSSGDKSVLEIVMLDTEGMIDTNGEEVYNANDVRIIYKGIHPDDSPYTNALHILFLVENASGKLLEFEDVYNSLSINGFMTDTFSSDRIVRDGGYGLLDIYIMESSLTENNIASVDDINEFEIGLKISEDYNKIDETTVKIKVK